MKHILFAAIGLFLLTTMDVSAQQDLQQYDRVEIALYDGSLYSVQIDTLSSMHSYFDDGQGEYVVDVTGHTQFFQFLRSEISSISFTEHQLSAEEQEELGIQEVNVEADRHDRKVIYRDGSIWVSESQAGQVVRICQMSGRLVRQWHAEAGVPYSLDSLEPGLYLVFVKGSSLKIMKQ